ncbi:MAG: YkgJ family cysteine cluster protein [Sedimentisphaeraceae bacterium JB056]
MTDKKRVIEEVEEVYKAIDQRMKNALPDNIYCKTCGCCCDFKTYGHRLYVTTPEILYFNHFVPVKKKMEDGVCPYRTDENHCEIHPYRFSGCRIYLCDADKELQSELSEFAISRFRQICEKHDIEYRYTDLAKALELVE